MQDKRKHNKQLYYEFARSLRTINEDNLKEIISKYTHDNINWNGPYPLEIQDGLEDHLKEFWEPFIHAFPDIEKNPYVMIAGTDEDGKEWVSATGYYRATFVNDWLGIPHTGRPIFIRFGEWCEIVDDKIISSFTILDVLDVMRIAGIDLGFPVWGSQELALGPAAQDGLWITEDDRAAQKTIQVIHDMIGGMRDFDGVELDTMHQWDFWDADRMIWAGPAGIGQSRGLAGYQSYHQMPWLKAFPDRQTHGEVRFVPFFAENQYVCGGCWSDGEALYATHTGGDLMGLAATGKGIKIRDYDWWRIEDGKIIENWCMIDNAHLLKQLGIDIFARMEKIITKSNFNRCLLP